jgi:hypothetical protein
MVFNIVARNQDDHVKNIAFLMDKTGAWSLSPAFDVTYSYSPAGAWTATHQMTLNGKRDGFAISDINSCARSAMMKQGRAEAIVEEVRAAVTRWPEFAAQAGVADVWRDKIQRSYRWFFPRRERRKGHAETVDRGAKARARAVQVERRDGVLRRAERRGGAPPVTEAAHYLAVDSGLSRLMNFGCILVGLDSVAPEVRVEVLAVAAGLDCRCWSSPSR